MLKKIPQLLCLIFLMAGCATKNNFTESHTNVSGSKLNNDRISSAQATDAVDEFVIAEPDPLIFFNKYVHGFNRIFDTMLLQAVALGYKNYVPTTVQYCARSVVQNLGEPLSTINYILQGNPQFAAQSFTRFVVNSTLGLLGLVDVAKSIGLNTPPTEFNATLAKWGCGAGPHIVLPFLGPTTLRGALGIGVNWFSNPLRYASLHSGFTKGDHRAVKDVWLASSLIQIIDNRAKYYPWLDDIFATSKDSYVTLRNITFQKQSKFN